MAATSCVQGYQPKVNSVTRIHVLIIIMQNFRFHCSTDKTSILQIFYPKKNGEVHITKCLLISVDGGWSRWHTHRHHRCSVTCGGGVHTWHRNCNNPHPAYGGQECQGPSTKTVVCKTQPCPGNCNPKRTSYAWLLN